MRGFADVEMPLELQRRAIQKEALREETSLISKLENILSEASQVRGIRRSDTTFKYKACVETIAQSNSYNH